MTSYPEHDKLAAVKDDSQTIGEFIDMGRWWLCELVEETPEMHEHWQPVHDIQDVLAEYFGIDRDRLEVEKRAMLDAIREANPQP